MNNPNHFRENLQVIKEESGLSLTKFSERLEMPRSTIQSVMDDGHTSLDTACRIANALQLPLSILTGGALPQDRADVLHDTLVVLEWYRCLPAHKQKNIQIAFSVLLDELEK